MRLPHTVLAVGLAWTITAALVGGLVWGGHETALQRGHRGAEILALVLEEHTARTFQAIDLALSTVADAHATRPGLPRNDPAFQRLLTERMQQLPSARALFVIGPDGYIRHDTDYPSTPSVSLADRPYFQRHAQDPRLRASISAPLQSRTGLGWFLAATRTLGRGDRFEGIAVAAIQPGHFEMLYRRMGLADRDMISLLSDSGVLVARFPVQADATGKSFASSPLFAVHLPKGAHGTYRTSSGVFSFDRVVSYRRIENLPFVVVIDRDVDTMLAEWRRTATAASVAMGVLTLLLALFVLLAMRQHRQREAEAARRVQADKLEAIGRLTGGIAHDFGNLLAIMATNLRVLADAAADRPAARQAIEVTRRAIDQSTQLIARLRLFARRQPLAVAPADLDACIRDAESLLRQAAGSGNELALELAGDLPPCLLDASQLDVALVNLVINARDAMAQHAGDGRIVLRSRACTNDDVAFMRPRSRGNAWVCLVVQDDGGGMTDEVKRRAVEPYFTTKGEAGTGLGLAQVYGYMQAVGGSMRIDSSPGKGTAVHLFFVRAGPVQRPAHGPQSR